MLSKRTTAASALESMLWNRQVLQGDFHHAPRLRQSSYSDDTLLATIFGPTKNCHFMLCSSNLDKTPLAVSVASQHFRRRHNSNQNRQRQAAAA